MLHSFVVTRSPTQDTSSHWYPWVYHNSTEFITEGQINGISGPELPKNLSNFCAVKLSQQEIFVIGGGHGNIGTKDVWIFNPDNGFERTAGPYLNIRRTRHSCGTMRDGGKTVIVVAGGNNGNDDEPGLLDSVEIYDPTVNAWNTGIKGIQKELS